VLGSENTRMGHQKKEQPKADDLDGKTYRKRADQGVRKGPRALLKVQVWRRDQGRERLQGEVGRKETRRQYCPVQSRAEGGLRGEDRRIIAGEQEPW